MPVIEQEIDAMLLELDRVGRVVRDALHDFDRGDLDFESAGRALIGVDAPGDDHAGFLRQPAQRFECRRLVFQRDDALDRSRAVAENGEEQFAGFAQVVQPAAQRDFLPVVLSDILNGDYRHRIWFLSVCM